MYNYKKINFGFIVLCSDNAISLLGCTVKSIKRKYDEVPIICVTDKGSKIKDIKDMEKICPTFKGKDTYSSLINVGFKNTKAEWNFIIFAGTTVRRGLDIKFSKFIEDEKDILFPIADGQSNFIDGTMNGLLINKETFKVVGKIDEKGSFDKVKTLWAAKAIEKGCRFKALSNTKMC